jgi:hypothetical protein
MKVFFKGVSHEFFPALSYDLKNRLKLPIPAEELSSVLHTSPHGHVHAKIKVSLLTLFYTPHGKITLH